MNEVVGPGRIVLLEEVPAIAVERQSTSAEIALRVTGTVRSIDCFSGIVTLQHRDAELAVDISLLQGAVILEHQLYQFIGELEVQVGKSPAV